MTFRSFAWELRFKLQKDRTPNRIVDGVEFTVGTEVMKDISTSLLFVGFSFVGKEHAFFFPDELREVAPRALQRIFLSQAFNEIGSRERTVVDVGSFIGDSAIYFALRGARRVVALEPSLEFCQVARVNMDRNGLAGIVEVVNEGAGSPGFSQQPEDQSNPKATQEALIHREWAPTAQDGIRINSLRDLIGRFKLDVDAALKVNCEGCEYSLIMNATEGDLRHFSEMLIEYHYGSKRLEGKLAGAGFRLSKAENRLQFNEHFADPRLEVGWLHASRVDTKGQTR